MRCMGSAARGRGMHLNPPPGAPARRRFLYTTALDAITSKMVALFDVAIGRAQGLSSLEPAIMENLFWASTPVLSSVHPQVRPPRHAPYTSAHAFAAPAACLGPCVPRGWTCLPMKCVQEALQAARGLLGSPLAGCLLI